MKTPSSSITLNADSLDLVAVGENSHIHHPVQ